MSFWWMTRLIPAGPSSQAVNLIKENGAQRIYVAFVHPIFSADAAQRLAALPVTEYITTDSVPISLEKQEAFGKRLTILTVAAAAWRSHPPCP